MKTLILFLPFLLMKLSASAQLQFGTWYFGQGCGLTYASTNPQVLSNGVLWTAEGCASISNSAGNFLFYTDGITVINSSQSIMANGTGLGGHQSSTQSAIIVKQPASDSLYYIFTTPGTSNHSYSIVDMSLAAGLGSVTTKNSILFGQSTERQVSIRHCNGRDVWIVAHENNTSNFRSYLLNSSGVNTIAIVSSIGPVLTGSLGAAIGCLKTSPDGKKLAMSTYSNAGANFDSFILFDFDAATGVVSNSISLHKGSKGAYGMEFSPDGSKLYGTVNANSSAIATTLFQWDICSSNSVSIINSEYSVSLGTYTAGGPGMIQRAIDNLLYISVATSQSLHVINTPNQGGSAMGLSVNALNCAPGVGQFGLPNFINKGRIAATSFVQNTACQSGTFSAPAYTALSVCSYTSNPYTAYKWDFGDNASAQNTATTASANHFFSALGTYTVKLIMYANCTNDTITQVVNVTASSPSINVAGTFTLCKGDNRIYTASGGNSYQWSGSAVTNASISLSPTATTAYTATAVQGSCATSQAFTVTVNKCTGVSEQEESLQVQLFPNPAKEHISLQLQSAANLRVLALDGKILKQQTLQTGTTDVDVTQLPAGLYIFEISDGTQMYRERVVIGN